MGGDGRIRKPSLDYSMRETSGSDIIGDGPQLDSVFNVSCWEDSLTGELDVWVRGRMLRADGTPGKRQRSVCVDPAAYQPKWLRQIMDDARRRLDLTLDPAKDAS